MDFKVLVTVYVPEIEKSYDLYLPINKTIGSICNLLVLLINEDTSNAYPKKKNYALCNRYNSQLYKFSDYLRDTDIRNGSQLVFY